MNQLIEFSDTRFNPPERKVRSYKPRDLELMTSDMMDRLLANGKLLSSCIYDGDDNSLRGPSELLPAVDIPGDPGA